MARLGRGFPNLQRARAVTVFPVGGAQALAGTSALTTGTSADLTVAHDLAGLSALVTGLSAAITVAHTLAGSSALTFGSAADLTVTVPSGPAPVALAGTSALSTGASATTMAVNNALVGVSNLRTSSGYADMTVHFTFQLEGTARLVSGAIGNVGVNYALAGTSILRTGATATATPDPTFTFVPPLVFDSAPVTEKTFGVERRLFRYYGGNPRGLSVVKVAGHYTTIDGPYQELLVGTDGIDYFLGGHNYQIPKAVALALQADGYTTS